MDRWIDLVVVQVLKDRGIPECYGWTVSLEDGAELVELNGDDFVLDAIGELELPPAFPGMDKELSIHIAPV